MRLMSLDAEVCRAGTCGTVRLEGKCARDVVILIIHQTLIFSARRHNTLLIAPAVNRDGVSQTCAYECFPPLRCVPCFARAMFSPGVAPLWDIPHCPGGGLASGRFSPTSLSSLTTTTTTTTTVLILVRFTFFAWAAHCVSCLHHASSTRSLGGRILLLCRFIGYPMRLDFLDTSGRATRPGVFFSHTLDGIYRLKANENTG